MTKLSSFLVGTRRLARDLMRDSRGNVLMLMAFAVIPLTAATGMSIDYARAARLQTRLNAAADAAALAGVTLPMMSKDNAAAKTAAQNMFNSQVTGLYGLEYNPADLTVEVTGTVGAANERVVKVTYRAWSDNAFAGVLGVSKMEIGGTSTATAAAAPNIDFYVMLDTSPSMLLPSTKAGLQSMTAATGGCAFACHQTDKNPKTAGDLIKVGNTYVDFYQISVMNSITLRSDVLRAAISDLTDTATATAAETNAKYRMGLFGFDYRLTKVWPTTPSNGYYLDGVLSNVKNHVADAKVLAYCRNNQRVCGTSDNDTATNYTVAMTDANSAIPAPGGGSNEAGDKPQAILFLLTDGMRDESNNGRKMGPIPTALCDTIKARGIRIAVLYTEYLPESASDTWSVNNVKTPYLSPTDKISPALTSCASSGLFYKVSTDSDISAALSALFHKAISTARLSK